MLMGLTDCASVAQVFALFRLPHPYLESQAMASERIQGQAPLPGAIRFMD